MKAAHCVGLFSRSGYPADTQGGHSGYQAVMGGYVINNGPNGGVTWANMQASAGSPAGSGTIANGAIDSAFVTVKNYNNTGPAIPWTLKLRVFAGIYQPAWLKGLAGTSTFGPLLSNGTDTMLGFWTPAFRAVWSQFMQAVAAYVPADGLGYTLDTHPNLGEVVCGGAMTTYAEPMLQTGWTIAQLGFASQAAFFAAAEPALLHSLLDTNAAWPNTPVSLACNPYGNSDVTFTKSAMAYLTSSVGSGGSGGVSPKGVVENNSLRANLVKNSVPAVGSRVTAPATNHDPNTGATWCDNGAYSDGHGGNYTTTYIAMAKLGQGAAANALGGAGFPIANPSPMCIQTDMYPVGGGTPTSLMWTLSYAVWLGARMVELPSGYAGALTPAQLGNYNTGLFANDPVGGIVPTGPFVQDVSGGTPSANTTLVVANAPTTVGNTCALVVGARGASAPTISVAGGGVWTNRINQNSASLNGNLTVWDLVPVGSIGANGITITSTVSGSIEYEFYEISGLSGTPYETSTVAHTGTTSTAPTVSATPAHASDVVVGGILWPNAAATISGLSTWTNEDPSVVGSG